MLELSQFFRSSLRKNVAVPRQTLGENAGRDYLNRGKLVSIREDERVFAKERAQDTNSKHWFYDILPTTAAVIG